MNILIPHSWLLEHLETTATPEEIQKIVSLSGPSIERIYTKQGEAVYDIEVTTNRVDSMSIRGIAREVAVILQQSGTQAQLKPLSTPNLPNPEQTLPLPEIICPPELCKRITCVIIKNIKRTPTPDWMAQRLLQIDQNIHDSAIDITNYVTHELGHPCHAFDYEKIMELGGSIIVKEAEANKEFTTLDGSTYKTVGGEVVFENKAGQIIDLPAIKGTANTSVSDTTKHILLWIENIDAQKVRFASMKHAIRTVAAQLSEKHVDHELAMPVIQKGAQLYLELCQAEMGSNIYDYFPGKRQHPEVVVPLTTIDAYLGIELKPSKIQDILTQLECQVKTEGENDKTDRTAVTLRVTPPSFRPDITIPADVVEEIARIYGYHTLPSILMDTAIPTIRPSTTNFVVEQRIKDFLAHQGWQEVYTYSMVSQELALASGFGLADHLKIQNPLTDDRVYLRRSLLPSLQEIQDSNPQHPELWVFEIANVYHPQLGSLPEETLRLGMVCQSRQKTQELYRQTRGMVESLLRQFFIIHLDVIPDAQQSSSGTLMVNETLLGHIHLLSPSRVGVDIDMQALLTIVRTHPTYKPLPKAEAVQEDLTFTMPAKTPVGPILKHIATVDARIHTVVLSDVYQQNHTFTITYLNPEASLSTQDVEPMRKQIVRELEKLYQAKLVGSLQ